MQKSIDFLLEHAGPVIQYRLRRDILHSLTPADEDRLLKQIEQLPLVELLKTYLQPNAYIGRGMHSWDNWRGEVLHQTPLQDGETAAHLLSYYGFSKEPPLVANYAAALSSEAVLRDEFSYIPPETARFENRLNGLNNGNCLMTLVYTMLAMLGYGDDIPEACAFQQTALNGFRHLLQASSLEKITHFDPAAKRRYNYPFIEEDDFFPNVYTLALLA